MPEDSGLHTSPPASGGQGQVLVLRLWREPTAAGGGMGAWRASLLNPLSKHRHHFTSPEQLSHYLRDLDLRWPDDAWDDDDWDVGEQRGG